MFSFIQSLRQRATEGTPFVEETTAQQAQEGTTTITSLLSGVASTVKQIQSSVTEQLSTIIQEEAQITNASSSNTKVYLPWEDPGLPEHWRGFEVELKRNILYISRNRSVFLFQRKTPREWNPAVAMKLLEADPYLQEAQYKLVPKTVSEEIFFQNYFSQIDNIVNFQRPAQHYFTMIQKSLQTGENLESNAKHVQILKKRIAEQLLAFENTDYYDELLKLNDVCKNVLVQASRKYTAMNSSSNSTSAPATPTTSTKPAVEAPTTTNNNATTTTVPEQHTETDEANVGEYGGDSDDEDVKLPWEEDEEEEKDE